MIKNLNIALLLHQKLTAFNRLKIMSGKKYEIYNVMEIAHRII